MDKRSEEFPRKFAFNKLLYWKLEDLFIFRVYRDRDFIPLKMDKLVEFWNKVERGKTDEEFLSTIIPTKMIKKKKSIEKLNVCQI